MIREPDPEVRLRGATIREVQDLPSLPPGEFPVRGIQVRSEEVLLEIPGLARWRIRSSGIEVQVVGPDRGRILALSATTPLAAWWLLQGGTAFSGATVLPPGSRKAVMLCGRPGVGISTTVAELCGRGWTFHSDGIVLARSEQDAVASLPAPPESMLWDWSLRNLSWTPRPEELRPTGLPSRSWWSPREHADGIRPLGAVVVLRRANPRLHPCEASPLRTSGLDRLKTLDAALFQPRLAAALGRREQIWKLCSSIAAGCEMQSWTCDATLAPCDVASRLEDSLR